MTTTHHKLSALQLCALSLACFTLLVVCGCETGDDTVGLTISPSETSLSLTNNSVVLSVSSNQLGALSLPLSWSVSDPSLGNIAGFAGNSAVYTRSTVDGSNIIKVQDQTGARGIAVVNQD
jgi:hypothetical protein